MKKKNYKTIRVQFRFVDDNKYYLIDLNPKNIEFGDIVVEKTYSGYRLTEIDSLEMIDYNIHRKVITDQDHIGMRTVYDVIQKLELPSIKNLFNDEAVMWVETENDNTPIVEKGLYICSYLYYPTAVNILDQEDWEKAMLEPHSYYDIDAKAKYVTQQKLEKWEKHVPSSWLGKWYRQIQIDKLKRKLEDD